MKCKQRRDPEGQRLEETRPTAAANGGGGCGCNEDEVSWQQILAADSDFAIFCCETRDSYVTFLSLTEDNTYTLQCC